MNIRCFLGLLMSFSAFAQMRIIPHVTAPNGGFTTSVVISNLNNADMDCTITAYTSTGGQIAFRGTMTANVSSFYSLDDLFKTDDVSHMVIEGDDNVVVSVAYASKGTGSPAHVSEYGQQSKRWRLFPGNWDHVFDGLAIVNVGTVPTTVLVAQFDASGTERMAVQVSTSLASMTKTLVVLKDAGFLSEAEIGASYFEVIADQPIALTALRGSYPGSDVNFLWQNPAIPSSGSISY
ncbi:MAG: hypothetical protein KDC35_17100 [Acidobacteria bacterium]|nr:hypothetical protein [Acidobacteriota bacterium]